MTINGVFFDLYGTLLEYGDMTAAWQAWLDGLHGCLRDAGLTIKRDELARACDGFLGRPEPVVADDGLTVYERRISVLGRELGLSLDRSTVRRAAAASAGAWQRYVTPDPQAIPVLASLAPTKALALVSNFDHPPHLHRLLAEHGLAPLFQEVVVSSEVGVKKPDPAIFASALATTGLSPHEVAYVGDSDEDIQAALAGGLVPVRIERYHGTGTTDGADFKLSRERSAAGNQPAGVQTITSLSQLLDLFG
jgi:putative hydrolase of the HAD superfamily